MLPRGAKLIASALVAVAVLSSGVYLIETAGSSDAGAQAAPLGTEKIGRATLLDARTASGTLGFGSPVDAEFISRSRSGIVTWIAPEGATISRGEPLYAIDGQPVVLFYGELPLFRSLRFRGDRFSDFDWVELDDARDDERKAELQLAAQRARVAEAQARLAELDTYVADTLSQEPATPQFIRLAQAVAAARDRLHRIGQLAEKNYAAPAELQQARVDLAAAQAELDATAKDRLQQRAAAHTALADARVAEQAAARSLRDARDASEALLSSARENRDVDMLRGNLVELGYTGSARRAIQRWQSDAGRSATGLIEPGQIVVAAGPVRVAAHLAEVGSVVYSRMDGQGAVMPGSNASNQIVRYTSTEKIVSVPLEVADHDYARTGDAVVVTLPTNVTIPGEIRKVSAEFDAQGKAITEIAMPQQDALGTLEAASVDVEFVIGKRSDVLAVPVTALIARANGGFAIEIVEGNSSRLLPVTTGLFARGLVEISGENVAEGMTVRVPR